MRLGQLARKLGTSTSDIVQFLGSKNIPIEDGINTRIEDLLVTTVVQHFAPERMAELTTTTEVVEPVEEVMPVTEPTLAPVPALIETQVPEETPVASLEPAGDEPSKIEVIKAPKVELSGLKVLGKIDLPEPKKKEEAKTESGESAATEDTPLAGKPPRAPRDVRKDSRRNQPGQNRQPRKNPVALQREREEQEAKAKREEQLKREKERKAQHYFKKVKVVAPTKAAKILREQVEEMSPVEERPKTFWGRLKKWFTT